jgi:putative (di)nucleoside polyphosphate hydrolase
VSDVVKYRPNVAAILQRQDGRILVGERHDIPGSWQFPQGGIHGNETPEEALRRELAEELSLSPECYRVCERRGPYRYAFPPGRTKEGFGGQEQTYFLAQFLGPDHALRVETPDPEFRAIQWILPEEFKLEWLLESKREVYARVLHDFFGVSICL